MPGWDIYNASDKIKVLSQKKMKLWVDKLEEVLEVENAIRRSKHGKVQEENTVKENNKWMNDRQILANLNDWLPQKLRERKG